LLLLLLLLALRLGLRLALRLRLREAGIAKYTSEHPTKQQRRGGLQVQDKV
jgi:hypothetical protein